MSKARVLARQDSTVNDYFNELRGLFLKTGIMNKIHHIDGSRILNIDEVPTPIEGKESCQERKTFAIRGKTRKIFWNET